MSFLFALLFLIGLVIECFLKAFLQGQLLGFGLLICSQKDFLDSGSKFFISRSALFSLLLITSLLAKKTWYI